jgi:hypothetical protein
MPATWSTPMATTLEIVAVRLASLSQPSPQER